MYSVSFILLPCYFALTHVTAFPTGPISVACDDMMPLHRGLEGDLTESPYKIEVEPNEFCPGDTLTVTVSGAPFKGVFIQARNKSAGSVEGHVGNFQVDLAVNRTKTLTCNGWEAISHSQRLSQSSISVKWVAPPDVNVVQFFATTVESFDKFWVKQPGEEANLIIVTSP